MHNSLAQLGGYGGMSIDPQIMAQLTSQLDPPFQHPGHAYAQARSARFRSIQPNTPDIAACVLQGSVVCMCSYKPDPLPIDRESTALVKHFTWILFSIRLFLGMLFVA